jgi:phosphohistidine phosphatase
MAANRLYFAQHGLAVDKGEDPERPLSETGVKQTEMIAEALRKAETPISSIFHSGKLRASQTADIFALTLNASTKAAVDGLSPNDNVALLAQKLNVNDALYVGHLPHLEKLVTYLVTNDENNSIIKFQNSAVACLAKSENCYHLRWYLTPDLLPY